MDGSFRRIRVAVKAPADRRRALVRVITLRPIKSPELTAHRPRIYDDNRSDVVETSLTGRRLGDRVAALHGQQPKSAGSQGTVPIFTSDTRLVVCHTTVVDKSGKLVTNLKEDAFSGHRRTTSSRTSCFSSGKISRSPWG